MGQHRDGTPYRVLLVDDDADIANVVLAILTDEDYLVEILVDTSHQSVMAAVGMQEPDCILLDGAAGHEYGSSWAEAAYLGARDRAIPTIMFSAHSGDVREAQREESDRARAADFAAVSRSRSASMTCWVPLRRHAERRSSSSRARPATVNGR